MKVKEFRKIFEKVKKYTKKHGFDIEDFELEEIQKNGNFKVWCGDIYSNGSYRDTVSYEVIDGEVKEELDEELSEFFDCDVLYVSPKNPYGSAIVIENMESTYNEDFNATYIGVFFEGYLFVFSS